MSTEPTPAPVQAFAPDLARQVGDGVLPAPGAAALVFRTRPANGRRARRRCRRRLGRAAAGLAFGIDHGPVAGGWAWHGVTPKRDVTKPRGLSCGSGSGWGAFPRGAALDDGVGEYRQLAGAMLTLCIFVELWHCSLVSTMLGGEAPMMRIANVLTIAMAMLKPPSGT